MLVFPNTLIYVGVYFPLCPLYCNTVLANLNARQVIEKLQRRPAHDSSTLWRDEHTSGLILVSGRSNGSSHGHELSRTQVRHVIFGSTAETADL